MQLNLHYQYIIKLFKKTQNDIDNREHHRALSQIAKAFTHIDYLQKTPRVRGTLPLEIIEEYRVKFAELASGLPPSLYYSK